MVGRRAALRIAAAALLVVLALALVSGCFLPIFDLETSLAYQTASKMNKLGTIGPIQLDGGDLPAGADYFYLPSRMVGPPNGLVVVSADGGLTLHYIAPDPFDGSIRALDKKIFAFDNSDAGAYGFTVAPLVDGSLTVEDAYFIAHSTGADAYLATWGYSSGNFSQQDQQAALALPMPPLPELTLSVALDTTSPPGTAPFVLFMRDDLTPTQITIYSQTVTDIGLPAGPLGGTPTFPLPDGGIPSGGVGLYESSTNTYVFSQYDNGIYNVYRWDLVAIPELLPVHQRIDAILSNGYLYHRGTNSDEVYDASGNKKYSIASGKLHFAYENSDGAQPVMYYTLAYIDATADDDDNMYVDIYWIATSDIGDLD